MKKNLILQHPENDSFLVDILSTNECICFSQLRNRIPIFGSSYEANLTSINKIIENLMIYNIFQHFVLKKWILLKVIENIE